MIRIKFLLILLSLCLVARSAAETASAPSFTESECTLKTPDGTLSGTIVIPEGVPAPSVVLIIAGSGPTDRNGNSSLGLSTNVYKMLAEGLASNGIASLRYDKRGIGKSAGAMGKESDLRFETYVDDAAAWLAMLKADKRFSHVIVLGHSEGSLLGMIAARQKGADGFISIAGAGRPADKILTEQLANLPPGPMLEARTVIASLKSGKTVDHVDPNLAAIFRQSVQPYIISWMRYDPAVEIAKLKMPVLIIQGSTDLQVSVADAKLLGAARPDATLRIIPKMNHVLKESDAGVQANLAAYSNSKLPLIAGLIEDLVKFIHPAPSK